MKAKLNYNGREIIIEDIIEYSGMMKLVGLMFARRERARALLFNFSSAKIRAIHSFFVFFPFVAVWLSDGKIVEIQAVMPFLPSVKPKKPFDQLVEIPLNNSYKEVTDFLVERKV
ncbi:MAG: hypothetical protein AABX65_01790 [Nanoarchaeota archaeon]